MCSMVPSVSTQGWLTTVGEKSDRLLSYFFSSEYSQSKTFYGKISSLPYLLSIYQNKPNGLAEAIETELIKQFSPYFDQINFTVKVIPNDDSETVYTISISAKIIDNGIAYELSRVILVNDSIIQRIISDSQL